MVVKFIDNVNEYITEMKIKKSFVSLKSGWPPLPYPLVNQPIFQ